MFRFCSLSVSNLFEQMVDFASNIISIDILFKLKIWDAVKNDVIKKWRWREGELSRMDV